MDRPTMKISSVFPAKPTALTRSGGRGAFAFSVSYGNVGQLVRRDTQQDADAARDAVIERFADRYTIETI